MIWDQTMAKVRRLKKWFPTKFISLFRPLLLCILRECISNQEWHGECLCNIYCIKKKFWSDTYLYITKNIHISWSLIAAMWLLAVKFYIKFWQIFWSMYPQKHTQIFQKIPENFTKNYLIFFLKLFQNLKVSLKFVKNFYFVMVFSKVYWIWYSKIFS